MTPDYQRPVAPVPDGAAGELWIGGTGAALGYLGMPDKTAEAFTDDGLFRTGDVGQIDADAYLHLIGRAKDLIITGGYAPNVAGWTKPFAGTLSTRGAAQRHRPITSTG